MTNYGYFLLVVAFLLAILSFAAALLSVSVILLAIINDYKNAKKN